MGTVKRGRKADLSGLETAPQECQLRKVVLEILGENRWENFYVMKENTSVGLVRWDEEENSWPGCRNGRNAKQQGWPFCAGFPCLQCFHPSQPSPDSPYQEPADAYSKQQPGHSILLRKSTIKLWCFKHYSWWNPHSIEGNAKTTSALMEQVFSPSHCFSDQISVPFVTHSIFLKLFWTFSEEIKLISSLLVLTFL